VRMRVIVPVVLVTRFLVRMRVIVPVVLMTRFLVRMRVIVPVDLVTRFLVRMRMRVIVPVVLVVGHCVWRQSAVRRALLSHALASFLYRDV